MIDRESRDRYAEQVRHFAAGVLSVDDYEERTDDLGLGSQDKALYTVWREVWGLYDDFRTERLRGDWKLNKEARRNVARCILFLQSNAEYRWPPFHRTAKSRLLDVLDVIACLFVCPFDLFTLEVFRLQDRWYDLTQSFRDQQWEKGEQFMRQFGDREVWPFLHQADYDAALKTPKLLAGAGS